jgi:ABC-type branched-subunit amino acid transport system substrate-binding protein
MTTPKRPRDTNQLAKSIVDIATGEIEDDAPAAKSEAQRKGGLKGAKVRAESLTPAQRSDIAKKAAEARWLKDK